jgi:heat shock protein HslJ
MKNRLNGACTLALLVAAAVPPGGLLLGQAVATGDTQVLATMLTIRDVEHRLISATANGAALQLPEELTVSVRFHSGGVFSGSAGVNRYFGIMQLTPDGSYELEPPGLAVTTASCEESVLEFQTKYLEALSSTRTLQILDDGIALSSTDGSTVLQFARTPMDKRISAVQDVEFRLVRLVVDNRQNPLSSANITFILKDSARFTGFSGVNFYSGTLRVEPDGHLQYLRLTEATQRAASPELMALESTFFDALGMVQRLSITTDGLILERDDQSVVLEFTSASRNTPQ